MSNLNFKTLFILIALVLLSGNSSLAQQSVSPEKEALIREFRELTGSQNITLSVKMTSADIEDSFFAMIERDKELTDAQKKELQKSVETANARIDKELQDFFADKAGIQQLSEETALALYDKNFTEAELRELITFYQTPIGKKSLVFLMSEKNQLAEAFGEAFKLKLQNFIQPIIEREQELLEREIKKMKEKRTIGG